MHGRARFLSRMIRCTITGSTGSRVAASPEPSGVELRDEKLLIALLWTDDDRPEFHATIAISPVKENRAMRRVSLVYRSRHDASIV
jgi:hypothetical protein